MTVILRGRRALVVGVLLASLAATGCGEAPSDEHVIDEPVIVTEIPGTDVAHVALEPEAAQRLDIRTAAVEQIGDEIAVPTAAVIFDEHGGFWVYTNPEPHGFVRSAIDIDREADGMAYITDGPPVGTPVVTLGAAELYGAERGIGH